MNPARGSIWEERDLPHALGGRFARRFVKSARCRRGVGFKGARQHRRAARLQVRRTEMPVDFVLLRSSQGENADARSRANERPGSRAREPVSIQRRPLWSFRASKTIHRTVPSSKMRAAREVRALAARYDRQPPAIFHSPPCSRSLGLPARPSPGTPHACLDSRPSPSRQTRPPLTRTARDPGADNVSCVTSQRHIPTLT